MPATNAFISYSHADEKGLERLHKHLAMLRREGSLSAWTDHAILPGGNITGAVSSNLENSSIFIALLSPDYLDSNYCYEKEFEQALVLANAGKIRIVPVVLEPCDWLASPFKDLLALPKDGQPISLWTNQNNAFLDVVTGLRKILEAANSVNTPMPDGAASTAPAIVRHPRVKQDFDSIQRADFADKAFEVISVYFRASCEELSSVGDTLRAKFEVMDATAFTCSVVNRAKRTGGEAHITVRNSKQRGFFGDISFMYQRHAEANSSNGTIRVASDDYNMFLTMNDMSMMGSSQPTKLSPEQVAETLWNSFVKKAGIEYE